MDMRGEEIPQPSEPTQTEKYHSENNGLLMKGGFYNYRGNLLNLVKFDKRFGAFRLYCKHYLDAKGNYKHNKGLEVESLKELIPCSAEEQRLLLSSYTPEDTIDHFERMFFNSKSKGYGKDAKVKSKAYYEAVEELSKEKEEKPKETINVDCGISEDQMRKSFKNGIKNFRK